MSKQGPWLTDKLAEGSRQSKIYINVIIKPGFRDVFSVPEKIKNIDKGEQNKYHHIDRNKHHHRILVKVCDETGSVFISVKTHLVNVIPIDFGVSSVERYRE